MKENAPQPRSREVAPSEPTLRRILVELDNGTVRYLEGDDARKHDEAMRAILNRAQVTRGAELPDVNWKEINVREVGSLFSE